MWKTYGWRVGKRSGAIMRVLAPAKRQNGRLNAHYGAFIASSFGDQDLQKGPQIGDEYVVCVDGNKFAYLRVCT